MTCLYNIKLTWCTASMIRMHCRYRDSDTGGVYTRTYNDYEIVILTLQNDYELVYYMLYKNITWLWNGVPKGYTRTEHDYKSSVLKGYVRTFAGHWHYCIVILQIHKHSVMVMLCSCVGQVHYIIVILCSCIAFSTLFHSHGT